MRCLLFGHALYADPLPSEFCTCRCGRTFAWTGGAWKRLPRLLTYEVDDTP